MNHSTATVVIFYLFSHILFMDHFTRPPNVVLSEIQGHTNQKIIADWRAEAAYRFPLDKFAMVFAHGVTRGAVWTASTDHYGELPVESLLRLLRLRHDFWGRRIVLICCNEGAHDLAMPRVSYAKNLVWVVPDSFNGGNNWRDLLHGEEVVGNIYEFTNNP